MATLPRKRRIPRDGQDPAALYSPGRTTTARRGGPGYSHFQRTGDASGAL